MKVIVTGATGFVGKQVVATCISNPAISSIIVLTRREIDTVLSQSPKVHVILHQNFEDYPPSLLDQLQEAQGCIWCLGGKVESFPDLQTAKKVSVDFTMAAATAFEREIRPVLGAKGKPFRFVFCSGKGAEWDQDKSLWVFSDTRKLKGLVERGLLDIAGANPKGFDAVILRPGGITEDASVLFAGLVRVFTPVVPVSKLASALVKVLLDPPKAKAIDNDEILRLAT